MNQLTRKVLVLYTEIIKKMFRNGFKVHDPDARFVQVGLAEREAIFRNEQVRVFNILINSGFLDVIEDVDETTGEIRQSYKYGRKGSEAKRYAIPVRLFGKNPKYHILDSDEPEVTRATKALMKVRKKKVIEVGQEAIKKMVEVLKTVKFCKDKATQAILSDNVPVQLLNTKRLGSLTLFDYIYYLNLDLFDEYAFHDYFGERLHHRKIHAPKSLRYCSMYFAEFPDEPICELDFANSQPSFLCNLSPKAIEDILPEFASIELEDALFKMRTSESFRKFYRICMEGDLKKAFMKRFGNQFSKKEIKKMIFSILYCNYNKKKNKYKAQLEAFKDGFPEVYEFLDFIKQLNWSHLKKNCKMRTQRKGAFTNASLIIQRFESRVMLNFVVPHIQNELPGVPFFTIHDSVVCLKRDKERIKGLIKDVFYKIGLQPPQINEKKDDE